jgi:hypothetical protein
MDLEEIGLPIHMAGACKMYLLPHNSSVFYVRIENLADDDFDTYWGYYEEHANDTNIDIPDEDRPEVDDIPDYIDLDKMLALMVEKHLGTIAGVKMSLEETSLTGGELYSDMKEGKTKWIGFDDDWLDESTFPKDMNARNVTLEAQRIRMFRVTLSPVVPNPRE